MKRGRATEKVSLVADKSIPFWQEEFANSDGTSEVIVHLQKTLLLSEAEQVKLQVGKEQVSIGGGAASFDRICIMQGFYEYLANEFFSIHLDDYGTGIRKIYVRIAKDGKSIYEHTHARVMRDILGDRAKFLKWFPPDLSPQELGIKINPRIVPQRTPFWDGIRGEVTGTKAYKLVGFFVPRSGTFDFFKKEVFDAASRARMDLGSESEDYGTIGYLLRYRDRRFEEVGYANLPKGYPASWGASPDGLILGDPSGAGVIEFKTSTSKRTFDAYFYPQVYFEMIAMEVQWCDVVRILRHPTDPMQMVLYVYRIHRDPAFESELLTLIAYAYRNADRLQKLVHDEREPFVAKRKQMEEMAKREEPVDVIELTEEMKEAFKKIKTK